MRHISDAQSAAFGTKKIPKTDTIASNEADGKPIRVASANRKSVFGVFCRTALGRESASRGAATSTPITAPPGATALVPRGSPRRPPHSTHPAPSGPVAAQAWQSSGRRIGPRTRGKGAPSGRPRTRRCWPPVGRDRRQPTRPPRALPCSRNCSRLSSCMVTLPSLAMFSASAGSRPSLIWQPSGQSAGPGETSRRETDRLRFRHPTTETCRPEPISANGPHRAKDPADRVAGHHGASSPIIGA